MPWPRLTFRWTIKRKIACAFAVLSCITAGISAAAVMGAHRAGEFATRTYDETVVTTAYARAASSDFSSMRAELAHGLMSTPAERAAARNNVEVLHRSFLQDLATAGSTSSSAEVAAVAEDLRRVEGEWLAMARDLEVRFRPDLWQAIESKAHVTERGIDDMVGRVSRAGFDYRTLARAAVSRDGLVALAGAGFAITVSAFVVWQLSRRISGPLGRACRFADEIAGGRFDGAPPPASGDEIGDLTAAMVTMRDDIRALMERQAVLQEQSQARVAEALDGSSEGVIVVRADGTVQLANARALDVLGLPPGASLAGTAVAELVATLSRTPDDRSALLTMAGDATETGEMRLPDGRWVRASRNRTAEGGMVALYTDVTEARLRRDQLAGALANLDGAMASMSQGLVVFDADGRLKLANPQFYALVGVAADAHGPGSSFDALAAVVAARHGLAPDGVARRVRHERALARRRRSVPRTVALGERVLSVTQTPMPEGGCLATIEDVTEQRKIDARIQFLATHDGLTRLPNRVLFKRRVDEALVRVRRGKGFAVHCLDLDRFKQVNDTLGHAVGDELLHQVSARLLACVRETDTVARLGGDEFAVLQADVDAEAGCATLADRVVRALSAPFIIDGQDVSIGVSIGIAMAPGNAGDHGALLRCADAALYKSKEDGRGIWTFFASALNEKLLRRHELDRDLRSALARGEFELHYQPILDTKTMRIGGLEALLRWRHPFKGMVSPGDFIPLAEETGLIREIGAWVMTTACREAATWPDGVRVAVNVSAVQLRDPAFPAIVADALLASSLPGSRLEIEITESVLMNDPSRAAPVLKALRRSGVGVAMDDFGTGFSSLGNLHSFPFDKIKIDRSFVRDLDERSGADQIIRAVVMIGRTMNMRVTAEGVETRRQLAFLEDVACDEIQGYLIGRPMPAADVPETLRQHNKVLSTAA